MTQECSFSEFEDWYLGSPFHFQSVVFFWRKQANFGETNKAHQIPHLHARTPTTGTAGRSWGESEWPGVKGGHSCVPTLFAPPFNQPPWIPHDATGYARTLLVPPTQGQEQHAHRTAVGVVR